MATELGGAKGCLLFLGIGAVMVGVGVAVWKAQSGGSEAFVENAAPYFDALVDGDYARAATLDHPARAASAAELEAGWDAREARWGELQSWNLHVANPGSDSDGAFIRATVQLTFEELSLIAVTVWLRPDEATSMGVHTISSDGRTADDGVW